MPQVDVSRRGEIAFDCVQGEFSRTNDDARKMKRLLLILAAAAGLAGAAAPGAIALARDGDQGRRAERHDRGPDRARRWEGERPGRGDGGRRWRDEDRRRFGEDRGGAYRRDEGPRRADRAPRRGGYLPDSYRGGFVDDYPRYRLRAPPRGYAWVRVGGGFALVSLEDGRIYDMVQ
jgi:Ni/Co efflux regulator RcnB